MANKKYELTDEKIEVMGQTLYRIKALRDLGDVTKGDLGGFVESENNLAHAGNAWVSGDARVYGNAKVYGNARVYGNAWVSGDARVYGNARVYGDAWVSGDARVSGNVEVDKPVINLIGICSFSVTAYADFLQIGCELHTLAEWDEIAKDTSGKYIKMAGGEAEYQKCKAVLDFVKKIREIEQAG